jgi:hypothetical protein
MKSKILCLLLIFSSLLACNEKPVKINDTVKNEGTEKKERDSNPEKTKPLPEFIVRDTIKINSDGPFMHKIKVGDIVSFHLPQFGSIGEESDYSIDNKEVLILAGSTFEYSNPSKAGMPGGDSGSTFLHLQAKKSGTCNLKISKIFRGKLKSELNYKITVE